MVKQDYTLHARIASASPNPYPHYHEITPTGDAMALNVFVVEDSAAVRDIMLEQIDDLPNVICSGYADSEMTAIEDLRRAACDILILDIKLKAGTGIGVLRAVAAGDWPKPPPTRIIFSNYTDHAFRTLAQSLGATHFFDKTRDFPTLLALISELASTPH